MTEKDGASVLERKRERAFVRERQQRTELETPNLSFEMQSNVAKCTPILYLYIRIYIYIFVYVYAHMQYTHTLVSSVWCASVCVCV